MRNNFRKTFQLIVFGIASALCLSFILYLKPPFEDQEFKSLIKLPSALLQLILFFKNHPWDLVSTILLGLAGMGLGFLVLEKAIKCYLPLGFQLGVGMGLLGLLIYLTGSLKLLYSKWIWGEIILLALLGIGPLFFRLRKSPELTLESMLELGLILIFSFAFTLVLVHPTTFYDSLICLAQAISP